MTVRSAVAILFVATVVAACSSGGTPTGAPPSPAASTTSTTPTTSTTSTSVASSAPARTVRWDHVVITVLENRSSTNIIGNPDAPYLNELARTGLNFTKMFAETHPSQPNYLALFSGSTQGITDDSCPHTFDTANLATQLLQAGDTFTGYSEQLPAMGYSGCDAYPYARRHVPWVNFANVPASANQPLATFPADYSALPTVSFVIPDVVNDMHDGSIAQGDKWIRDHLGRYVTWATTHHSLLIVTWDEDEGGPRNQIATMAVGDGVAAGSWTKRADHYTLLAVLEDSFGLPRLGLAQHATDLPPLR